MEFNNSIIQKMNIIQQEYLNLLLFLEDKLNKNNLYYFLDEIRVFWNKNAKKIEFIIENISENSNISFFTAATIFDCKGEDQYPFLLYNDYHIFDDPLLTYLVTSEEGENSFSEFMFKKVKNLIKDNIELIKKHSKYIWVLPIRHLYSKTSLLKNCYDQAERTFLSLFDDIYTLEDYFSNYSTIEELDKILKLEQKNSICFSEKDDFKKTFIERFNNIRDEEVYNTIEFKNDIHMFHFIMISNIVQSLHIILTAYVSKMVPFIRYRPAFVNFQLLVSNFITELEGLKIISAKSFVNYLIYQKFYLELKGIEFEKYYAVITKFPITNEINNFLEKNKYDVNPSKLSGFIDDLLKELNERLKRK